MRWFSRYRMLVRLTLTGVAAGAAILGNETVLPTAAIFALLAWQAAPPARGGGTAGRAARVAIVAYSLFMAALSLLISLFLPTIADTFHLTGEFDGDFVRVTTNDAHEFGYATCLLLALQAGFGLVLDRAGRRLAA